MNLGNIDMNTLRTLARRAGISDAELDAALAERRLAGLAFSAA